MLFEPASAAGSPFSVCFSHITWSGVGGTGCYKIPIASQSIYGHNVYHM